jgi:hypothetical protein
MIKVSTALLSLVPNAQFGIENNDYSTVTWYDTNEVPLPSYEQVQTEIIKLEQEWVKNEYQRLRRPEYPSIETQLDILYHKGYDGWKEEIDKIKNKYPKPGEG